VEQPASAPPGDAPSTDAQPADAQEAGEAAGGGQQRAGRYGVLLLLLITTYLISAFSSGRWVQLVQILLFVVTALLALRSAREPRRMVKYAVAIIVGGSLVALVVALTASSEVGQGVASIWTGLLLLGTVVLIVYRVLSFDDVTLQSIFGAISAYMILGLMFASFFAAINHLGGGHFFANGQPADTKTFQYFSFTTLTTLGYGDFTAASSGGRAVAVLEALTGQVFLATLVASLVAGFRRRR
jgi:hypothetical protein